MKKTFKVLFVIVLLLMCVTFVNVLATTISLGTITSDSEGVSVDTTTTSKLASVQISKEYTGENFAVLKIPTQNYQGSSENSFLSIKYSQTKVTDLNLYAYYSDYDENVGRDQWGGLNNSTNEFDYSVGFLHVANVVNGFNVNNTNYDVFNVSTIDLRGYISSDITVSSLELIISCEANATLDLIEMQFTSDGKHTMEVPTGEMTLGDIVGNDVVSVSKDEETGIQTLSYSELPGWKLCSFEVRDYDSTKMIFEFVCTPSDVVTLCFEINGKIDWALGHVSYASKENTIRIDVSSYNLPSSFSVHFYIDANATEAVDKTIEVKSYKFTTDEPLSEDLYFENPIGTAMTVLEDSEEGWNVSWTNDGLSWREVIFEVKNHKTEDVLAISLNNLDGRCLGIIVEYEDGTQVAVRDHWDAAKSLMVGNEESEYVYHLKAYTELTEAKILKIHIYFDPPTALYVYDTTNKAETKINSIQLLDSADLSLQDVTVTAQNQSYKYDENNHDFVISSQPNVDFSVYYKLQDATKYTTTSPKKVGMYDVKVVYGGSLTYNYYVGEFTLEITKADQKATKDLITFNSATGKYTFSENVIVATTNDFKEETILTSGGTISVDTTVYVKLAGNDNYNESEAIEVLLDITEADPTPDPTPDPEKDNDSRGCTASSTQNFITLSIALIAIFVIVKMYKVKTKEEN